MTQSLSKDLTRQIENAATLTEQALTKLLQHTEQALADLRAGRRMEQHLDGQLFLASASYHALFHAQRLGTLADTALAAGVDPEAILTAAIPPEEPPMTLVALEEDHCKMCEHCENESTHYNAEVASYLCDECED